MVNFKGSFITISALTLLLGCFLISESQAARVTFCSGANLSGTCATKNVEVGLFRNKCEDFPFRFRWFFTARSVAVENGWMGGCGGVCRLFTSDSCRCWFGNCPIMDFGCRYVNLPEGHGFEGVRCT